MGRVYIEAKNAMAKRKLWIESFPSGLKWINALPSKNTKIQYATYLKLYCDAVQKNPEELIALKVEGLKAVSTEKEFQAEDLLENFFINSKLKPNAKLSMKNAVFSFFKWNRRALEKTTASNVKTALPSAKTRTPTLEDIKALENFSSTARDKAIIRFIASTASRVGEVQQLKWNDLKPTGKAEVPYYLEIESQRLKGSGIGKYKTIKHIAFVNWWAFEMLQEYRKEAELKGYTLTENSPIFVRYYNLDKTNPKPLTTKGLFQLFEASSLRAWKDIEKKRFSPHDFRSSFNSALESTKLNENVIAPLMSHKTKGIAQNYSEHSIKELLECYIQALPYLIPRTASELETELKAQETKFETQQSQIEELKSLVTQLLNHEKDKNFSTISSPQEKQESKEILDKREQQFKKISPEYTHEPQKNNFSTESFKIINKKAKQ